MLQRFSVFLKGILLAGMVVPLAFADRRPYQQDAVDMLKKLVSYRTVKGTGTVPVMTD